MGMGKKIARVISHAGAMVMGTLLLAGPASAIPCAAPPPPALPVAVVGAGTSSFSYACGGLTFSNFTAIDAGGATGLPMNLAGATSDNAGARRVDLLMLVNVAPEPTSLLLSHNLAKDQEVGTWRPKEGRTPARAIRHGPK